MFSPPALKPFDGSEYVLWAVRMRSLLAIEGYWCYVEDGSDEDTIEDFVPMVIVSSDTAPSGLEIPSTPPDTPGSGPSERQHSRKASMYSRVDTRQARQKTSAIIISNLCDSLAVHYTANVAHFSNPSLLWFTIRADHERSGDQFADNRIHSQLNELRLDDYGGNIKAYVQAVRDLLDELARTAGRSLEAGSKKSVLWNGLPAEMRENLTKMDSMRPKGMEFVFEETVAWLENNEWNGKRLESYSGGVSVAPSHQLKSKSSLLQLRRR